MSKRVCMLCVLSCCAWGLVHPALATTYVVRPDGTGDFPTIQAAIDASVGGDIVALTDGSFTGDDNRDLDFEGKAITVESQSGNAEACIIDCAGSPGNAHTGFVFRNEEGADSILRGVTITGGYGDTIWGGGAISCGDPSGTPHAPTVQGCIFRGNYSDAGGAICIVGYNTTPTITECAFISNSAVTGGAIHCDTAGPTVENCRFESNQAESMGGACSFIDVFDFPAFSGCVFAGNQAAVGGALAINEGSPTFDHCLFFGNAALGDGGVMSGGGGTISPTFSSCTLSGNHAGGDGGGFFIDSYGDPVLEHSVLWGDCADGSGNEIHLAAGVSLTLSCCDVEPSQIAGPGSVVWGTGNIDAVPLFCEPVDCSFAPTTQGDYELQVNSPCVNAPGCGLIGALPVGCGVTSVTPVTWGAIKSSFR